MKGMPEGLYEVFGSIVEYYKNEKLGHDLKSGKDIPDHIIAEFGVYLGPFPSKI